MFPITSPELIAYRRQELAVAARPRRARRPVRSFGPGIALARVARRIDRPTAA